MSAEFRYFTSKQIYPGSNQISLQRIEAWIDLVRDSTNSASLGLFGPASTGKTTIANEIGTILQLPVHTINGALLTSMDEFVELLNKAEFKIQDGNYIIEPTIFFIDECHSINKKVQTQLLTFLESKMIEMAYRQAIFSKCIFIFATTDSSKMLQPLVTRMYTVTLSQYTTEDVANIVQMHLPNVDDEASLLTAKIAKNIPREAIVHTKIALSKTNKKILEKEDVISYLNSIGLDNDGLDSTDHQILDFLKGSNKSNVYDPKYREYLLNLAIIKELTKEKNISFSKKIQKRRSEIAIMAYKNTYQSKIEYLPRSRQDISLGCRLYDMRDLEIRLSYLEFLNKIEKTNRGIKYVE